MTSPGRSARILLPLFFGSGFAALVYQIVWQRLLTLFGGADVYSVTIIVAAFMAGLGLGSLAGGHLADRLSPRARLAVFAGAELAVAGFAFGSVFLLHEVLYAELVPLALSRLAIAFILLAVLLWPTFFMGLSLPLLARSLPAQDRRPEDWIGALYGVNTLGAALGALFAPWVLVRTLGFAGTVRAGVFINVACAVGGLILALGVKDTGPSARRPELAGSESEPGSEQRFSVWLTLYTLSGFVALSLEILWFRILGVILKSNAFTFSTLLALYLSGVGGGALLARRRARRVRSPRAAFLLLQSGITLYAAAAIAVFVAAVPRLGELTPLWRYLGDYDGVDLAFLFHPAASGSGAEVRLFLVLYLLVPILLIGPPTLLMGASFTFLQRAAQTDPSLVGRRVGWLQAANIAGSTLGTFVTGLWLLQALGTAHALRVLVVMGGVFLGLVAWKDAAPRRRPAWLAASLAITVSAVFAIPPPKLLWSRLHGASPDQVIEGEDGSGLSVLRTGRGADSATTVFVNGLSQSGIPYGSIHTRLGALPALLHPAPRLVLIVGLGSGDTAYAAGGRQETVRVDCVEIVAPQLATLRAFDRDHHYPGLHALLEDPRFRYTFTDGRAFLARSPDRYDMVEADALRPNSAYAGNLYSVEYFTLLRSRLASGGLGVTWAPTRRTIASFRSVFPHVLRFADILVGSESALPFDRSQLEARIADPFTREHFRRARIDIAAELRPLLRRRPREEAFEPTGDVNTDVFPRDEYRVP